MDVTGGHTSGVVRPARNSSNSSLACTVQTFSDDLRESLRRKRLAEKIDASFQPKTFAGDFRAVAADINHFYFVARLEKLFGQFFSGHPAGHHQVSQQQMNFIVVLFPDLQG